MEVRLDTSLELLLERAPSAHASRVLATVVATAGSTYRKPGARMLLMADGSYIGLFSGGCLESDLQIHARQVLESGAARAFDYDTRGPDDTLFGVGAGCEGTMRVLLEPAGPMSPAEAALAAAGRATRLGESAFLVMVHNSAQMRLGTYRNEQEVPADERSRAFVQRLAPPPHLLICGAAPDAEPVVEHRACFGLARLGGGSSSGLCESRRGSPAPNCTSPIRRALRAEIDLTRCHAAVVMSHHLPSDEAYLRELAEAGVPAYVGLLGPKARRSRLAQELGPAQ